MAQPLQPWSQNTTRNLGTNKPGIITLAGTFVTDASGNVTAVSGINPGMTVSGTSLSSGVYTVFFGEGPNVNMVGNGANSFAGGAPNIGATFQQVLYLQGNIITDNGLPTNDMIQTTQRDGIAGQGKLQYLNGALVTQSGIMKPGVMASKTVQVLAILAIHKDVT